MDYTVYDTIEDAVRELDMAHKALTEYEDTDWAKKLLIRIRVRLEIAAKLLEQAKDE